MQRNKGNDKEEIEPTDKRKIGNHQTFYKKDKNKEEIRT